jgi:hypothetical protein
LNFCLFYVRPAAARLIILTEKEHNLTADTSDILTDPARKPTRKIEKITKEETQFIIEYLVLSIITSFFKNPIFVD